ncbi:hypothetical protein EXE46_08015 [Halorubrum sp. GN11_10-6_MGM]|uniref:hypothetical protein n=1 Tax=Halorubrum sp. GN11_10-6_MGM TaxID=2518112 RepID=UPI0010F98CE4|nr:hypothetical protein [Halorubrum sp. GN11_10-6_MGM]TKX74637.1 hypothetical protein EXE46_08015 [Halorubrum sp. GN11_10-6_MGM]
MAEISERAQEKYKLTEDSYREILRRFRRDGVVKMARLDSTTYVYYPASYPDPAEACYVKVEGEKRKPDPEPTLDISADGNQMVPE